MKARLHVLLFREELIATAGAAKHGHDALNTINAFWKIVRREDELAEKDSGREVRNFLSSSWLRGSSVDSIYRQTEASSKKSKMAVNTCKSTLCELTPTKLEVSNSPAERRRQVFRSTPSGSRAARQW